MSDSKSICELSESSSISSRLSVASFLSPQSTLSDQSIREVDDSLDGSTSKSKRKSPSKSPERKKRSTTPENELTFSTFDFNSWSKSQISFFNEVDNFPLQVEFDNLEEKKRRKRRRNSKGQWSFSEESTNSVSPSPSNKSVVEQ
ncbi:hypothetical protein WA171_000847, partial [Blastocystis sp. BT1]